MENNSDFKEFILGETEYYKNIKVIDYYTGIKRSDVHVLQLITERFENIFAPVHNLVESIDVDKHFTELPGKETVEPKTKNIEINKIKEQRPSEETWEKIYNKRLEQIPDPNSIVKRDGSNNLETMLVIMSNILRNSEGVENKDLKTRAYDCLIKHSIDWMILYREYLLAYYIKNKSFPPHIPKSFTIKYIMKNTPFHVHLGMKQHLSTQKLAPIILEKITMDIANKTTSDIESFLSIALYSDIEGRDFPKYLKKFVKKLGDNVVRDFMLYKLVHYYYVRTRPGSPNEQIYIDLLAELKIKSMKGFSQIKEKVIKSIEDGKRKYLLRNNANNN